MDQTQTITTLLEEWRAGNADARDRLIERVYDQLRRIATPLMRRERSDHMLQTTALVHEAYIRLSGQGALEIRDRSHLFALLARQMRRILVDWARAEKADKRWGRQNRVAINDVPMAQAWRGEDLLALDEALACLETLDPRAAEVVELRYFAGLSEADTAHTLNVSVSTVKRDWDFARAWLATQLRPLASGQAMRDE
jgi:RNA polymerase sigma factor (TIGR02999 family)